MCWADWIGVLWGFVVYFGIFALALDKGAALQMFASSWQILLVVLPVWIIARLMDAAAGGPARRRRYR